MGKRWTVAACLSLVALGLVILLWAGRGLPEESRGSVAGGGAREDAGSSPAAAALSSGRGFLGVVVAREAVDVAAKLEGRVEAVTVRLGDRVSRGGRLALLDTAQVRRDLAAGQAALQVAQADQEKATLELAEAKEKLARRRNSLANSRGIPAISEEELAHAVYQEKLAAARLVAAGATIAEKRAHLEQLQQALADAEIRAPFDGVVAARYIDAGATVARGAPLVRLLGGSDLRLRFAVPADDAGAVTAGRALVARIDALDIDVPAVVEKVAPEVDPASGMVFVEARLAPPAAAVGRILAGRVARVSLASPPPAGKPVE